MGASQTPVYGLPHAPGPLTGDFLDLEREIDSFAGQYADRLSPSAHVIIRLGKHAGPVEQLTLIEGKATALREKAAQGRFGLTWPGRTEHAGTAGD